MPTTFLWPWSRTTWSQQIGPALNLLASTFHGTMQNALATSQWMATSLYSSSNMTMHLPKSTSLTTQTLQYWLWSQNTTYTWGGDKSSPGAMGIKWIQGRAIDKNYSQHWVPLGANKPKLRRTKCLTTLPHTPTMVLHNGQGTWSWQLIQTPDSSPSPTPASGQGHTFSSQRMNHCHALMAPSSPLHR